MAPVWIQQLTVPFTTLAKLKLESAFFVENLNSVVVRIGHHDIILRINGNSTRFGKLSLHNSEFAKLAVVYHLVAFNLRLGRKQSR